MTHPEFVRSRKNRTRGINRRDWLRQATTLVTGAAVSGLGKVHAQQQADGSAYLFPGFKGLKVQTSGATINVVEAYRDCERASYVSQATAACSS